MPSQATILANAIELSLAFIGLFVLWRLVLSPAARTDRSIATAPVWEGPISDFLLFLWLLITGGILGQFVAAALFRPLGLSSDGQLIFGNAAFELGMLGGIALYRLGLRHESWGTFAPAKALVSGLATFLIAVPLVDLTGLAWQYLMTLAGLPVERQDMIGRLVNAESHTLLFCMILLACVTAPIAEEMIFRAGIFRYARTRLPRWAALLVPACLFAALHQNLASFAQLAVLGVVFSLAYERTGRIGTAIVAHGLFNAHTALLVLLDPSSAN
jgi:membrane protease YdiL (CAAX protease family)